MQNNYRRSPIALAVLALLYEEPMHPYRMQLLIKQRGKDEVINVRQRASLYQTIERLQKAGLISVRHTSRNERWPERTVYALTEEGRVTVLLWMREMLATPAREFPEFPAALAYLPLLAPEDALSQLMARVSALEKELARIDAELRNAPVDLARLFLIETEYIRAMLGTELDWVRSLIDDLRSGRLTWSQEWQSQVAPSFEAAQANGKAQTAERAGLEPREGSEV
jgi:DNA-binding PadR family transcriptional regulator